MSKSLTMLKEAIFQFPSTLKGINNELVTDLVNYYLPYSTGFEVECNSLDNFNIKDFQNIENILDVNCDSSEKRFRIPNGLNGLICLHEICENLAKNCSLNMGSGIHYHIDMTDVWDKGVDKEFVSEINDYVIGELIKWETAKDVNSGSARCYYNNRGWVNFQPDFKTCEIRIGEMTFDYEIILKRIIDANRIIRNVKSILVKIPDAKRIEKLEKQLEELSKVEEDKSIVPPQEIMTKITNNRIFKISKNGKQ